MPPTIEREPFFPWKDAESAVLKRDTVKNIEKGVCHKFDTLERKTLERNATRIVYHNIDLNLLILKAKKFTDKDAHLGASVRNISVRAHGRR